MTPLSFLCIEISVQKIDIDYCCISTLLFSTINLEVNYLSVVKDKNQGVVKEKKHGISVA